MIAVNCGVHGFRVLTRTQFEIQKRQEGHWICPICNRQSEGIEINKTLLQIGYLQCKKDLNPESMIYNDYHIALFCDKLCEAVYLERFRRQLK